MNAAHQLSEDAFGAALAAAKRNLVAAEARANSANEELQNAKVEVARLRQLVDLLDAQLDQGKDGVRAAAGNTVQIGDSKRASVVYNNVVRLFAENPKTEFTVEDLAAGLAKKGICEDSKTIHNVIGYLMRQRKLRRVSRGRYYLPEYGIGVEMDEE